MLRGPHLDDLLHARGADHVGVGVEADLVDDGAVAFEDHEGPVHHPAWGPRQEDMMGTLEWGGVPTNYLPTGWGLKLLSETSFIATLPYT